MSASNINQNTLIGFDELPDHMAWLKDNPYLLRNYRKPTNSLLHCVSTSVNNLHTETLNIITHLIPTVFAVILIAWLFYSINPFSFMFNDNDWSTLHFTDRLTIAQSIMAIIIILGFSTIYHTFSSHEIHGGMFLKADLVGIPLGGFCIMSSLTYFILYSHYTLWCCSITANLIGGGICIALTYSKQFGNPRNKLYKSILFVAYAIILLAPSILNLLFNIFLPFDVITNTLLIASIALSLLGAILYAFHIPESIYPGRFDIWGQSHTIMHICTAISMFVIYQIVLRVADQVVSRPV